jgi:hypothetical protein
MALSRQSLRKGVHVLINGELTTKEELITLSEGWTERKEVFFRKMLQQGGKFKMDDKSFEIKIRVADTLRSDGEVDNGVTQIPGDTAF